jgi:hypothetical protein
MQALFQEFIDCFSETRDAPGSEAAAAASGGMNPQTSIRPNPGPTDFSEGSPPIIPMIARCI